MWRKGQRKRLRLRASRQLGRRHFRGFLFPFVFFFCFVFSLVCVIMCKVEEKQLEAALSGDGGGRGRNQSTSGLFKPPLASPCPESSAGPRGRQRFLVLVSSGGPGSEHKPCRGGHRRAGFVWKAPQKKMMEALLSLVDVFNLFLHPKILPHFMFPFVCVLPRDDKGGRTCLRALAVGAASRPSLSLSAISPPLLLPH